jgi:hypothetical protein
MMTMKSAKVRMKLVVNVAEAKNKILDKKTNKLTKNQLFKKPGCGKSILPLKTTTNVNCIKKNYSIKNTMNLNGNGKKTK